MLTMIQIRHVPSDVHHQLKARAAIAGQSLSDYVLDELRRSLERPTRQELLKLVAHTAPTKLPESAARAVRRERDSR